MSGWCRQNGRLHISVAVGNAKTKRNAASLMQITEQRLHCRYQKNRRAWAVAVFLRCLASRRLGAGSANYMAGFSAAAFSAFSAFSAFLAGCLACFLAAWCLALASLVAGFSAAAFSAAAGAAAAGAAAGAVAAVAGAAWPAVAGAGVDAAWAKAPAANEPAIRTASSFFMCANFLIKRQSQMSG